MDTFSVDKSFYEDLTELWDSDMEPVSVENFCALLNFHFMNSVDKLKFMFNA